MFKKIKSVFAYILFRTAYHYAHTYPKFSDFDLSHGGSGVSVFLIAVGAYIHFLMCILLGIFYIDITMFGNFVFQLLSFIPAFFSHRIERKYLGGLASWVKANKRDPAWGTKGRCVCVFYFFAIIQLYIQYWIHCQILGRSIIGYWQSPAYLHFK